jgi:hypothetical protein
LIGLTVRGETQAVRASFIRVMSWSGGCDAAGSATSRGGCPTRHNTRKKHFLFLPFLSSRFLLPCEAIKGSCSLPLTSIAYASGWRVHGVHDPGDGRSSCSVRVFDAARVRGNVRSGLRDSRARAFSYNERTTDRAHGAFLAVVADPRINKLHVINAANSPTPAASTVSFRINYLRAL